MKNSQKNAELARITTAMHTAIGEDGGATAALQAQIEKQLAALDIREDHYLDLVGNPRLRFELGADTL